MLSTIALISRLAREIAAVNGRARFTEIDWKFATAEAVRLIADERARNPDHTDDYAAAQAILDAMPLEQRNQGVQSHSHSH